MKRRLLKLFGYRYILNIRTGEIHHIDSNHANCNLRLIVHKMYLNEKTAMKLLKEGYDGCRWCLPKYDKYIRDAK